MPASDDGESDGIPAWFDGVSQNSSVELMLFESLVHHLIEKGVLTRNDALSIVQSVAEVRQGQMLDEGTPGGFQNDFRSLRQVYESFQAVRERAPRSRADRSNVRELRPPLHNEAPDFPRDD